MKILEVSQGLLKRKLKKAYQQKKQALEKIINQQQQQQIDQLLGHQRETELDHFFEIGDYVDKVAVKDKIIEQQNEEIKSLKQFKKQVLSKPVQHRKKKNSFMHYGDDPNGS